MIQHPPNIPENIAQAARAIAHADGLLIAAGAGMGVDSGLPDFRGRDGFLNAYPPYQKLGLDFVALANPRWFNKDPALAWGFYGHRLNLYRSTQSHEGFKILRSLLPPLTNEEANNLPPLTKGGPGGVRTFIYTSNVDGHFHQSGFDPNQIFEIHGSIHWLQCTKNCAAGIFPANELRIEIDETTMRALDPLPRCPKCCATARPNILMFNDWGWDSTRSVGQAARLGHWLDMLHGQTLVIIECGAGTAVPTVRQFCESIAQSFVAQLIRINPHEPEVPKGHIDIPMNALTALKLINDALPHSERGA